MEPVREGRILVCSECGVELKVVKDCECDDCEITCCGKPMEIKQKPVRRGGCCCRKS